MKLALLVLLSALSLGASTITYQASDGQPFTACGPDLGLSCPDLTFTIPQFSGPGLTSINWSFAGAQDLTWGVNDMYDPAAGSPYDVTASASLQSASPLPIDASSSEVVGLLATGYGQIGQGGETFDATLNGSGTDSNPSDLSAFEGNGTVTITLFASPYFFTNESDQWAIAGLLGLSESGTLSISYDPPNPVPEPRYTPLLGAVLLLLTALCRTGLAARRFVRR